MDILVAKKALYKTLRSFAEVVGVGIKERNGSEYIVIFLSKATANILSKIPKEYNGNKVEAEIRGEISAQS